MAEHVFEKQDVIQRLEAQRGKTLGDIDNRGIFLKVQQFTRQKGVAGCIVEQCIFGYSPDSKQEADLVILDGEKAVKTELKTTGMEVNPKPSKHFVAKEPMSITAVGVYDIGEQEFFTSHFWEKLEHMLIVYYHYASSRPVSPYEYKNFPLVGYEFHEFEQEDVEVLKNDWEQVRKLCKEVVSQFPGPKDKQWKEEVKQAYIDAHGSLRSVLSYVDLSPKFPPRFRLKKPTVSAMISNHFGYSLEQLPGRYTAVTDIDRKLQELTALHRGKTIAALAREFSVPYNKSRENKGIYEQIVVAMFGGTSKKLNQIALFEKFGFIAKSIALTAEGGRTEDMKLFHADFDEFTQEEFMGEDGCPRKFQFEDSELYTYFADHALLCIVFQEPQVYTSSQNSGASRHKLGDNIFLGFKRLVFTDSFIDNTVKLLWEDTRDKVKNKTLRDVVRYKQNGDPIVNKSGEISSAPNFMKSSDNEVFIRGSGADASLKNKTECVNGIKMLPQWVWIRGDTIVQKLNEASDLHLIP